MKLIAASTALFASIQAQSIESLIGDLINKVYQGSDDGLTHNINAAPFLVSTITFQENGFSSKGSFGNGNGVIEFSDAGSYVDGEVKYSWLAEGSAKSHPFVAMFPEAVHNDVFTADLKLKGDKHGFSHSYTGTINNIPWSNEMKLSLDKVEITPKKYTADVSFTRDFHVPDTVHEYWRQYTLNGKTDVKMMATAKKACAVDSLLLLSRSCTAKVTFKGTNDGVDFKNNVAKYTVSSKKAQLTITHDGDEMFWLGFIGIDKMEVLALKYKLNGGKAKLVVQSFGPNGLETVTEAGQAFISPFIVFFTGIKTADEAAHTLAYADKVLAHVQGKSYFNVYPIIEATRFESDLLANVLDVTSLQKAAKKYFKKVNQKIEDYANEAVPMVADGRDFVHGVTGSIGETAFGTWFAKVLGA